MDALAAEAFAERHRGRSWRWQRHHADDYHSNHDHADDHYSDHDDDHDRPTGEQLHTD